jgi:uncharacterized protein YbaR (Trm112 family)
MPLDPRLLEILCCPADGEGERCFGNLTEREDGLLCAKCGRLYPIEEGIPVMLVERATKVPS